MKKSNINFAELVVVAVSWVAGTALSFIIINALIESIGLYWGYLIITPLMGFFMIPVFMSLILALVRITLCNNRKAR